MKTYLVTLKEKLTWCMDYAMVVVAEDELHAERCARCKSDDFRKGKVEVAEIDMSQESVILVANTGA